MVHGVRFNKNTLSFLRVFLVRPNFTPPRHCGCGGFFSSCFFFSSGGGSLEGSFCGAFLLSGLEGVR